MTQNKKMSRFEHAILSAVNPEKAKTVEVKTEEEEWQEREDKLKDQASKMRIDKKNSNTQTDIQ